MTTQEILIAARMVIADEQQWTKGEDARDIDGEEVDARDEAAVCFCAGGAIVRVANNDYEACTKALDALRRVVLDDVEVPGLPIVYPWNDAPDTTHADVLAGFDRAIEASA